MQTVILTLIILTAAIFVLKKLRGNFNRKANCSDSCGKCAAVGKINQAKN